jgi:hypothetical protein
VTFAIGVTALAGCGGGDDSDSGAAPDPAAVASCLTDAGLEAKLKAFPEPEADEPTDNIDVRLEGRDSIQVTFFSSGEAADAYVAAQDQAAEAGLNDNLTELYGPTVAVAAYARSAPDELDAVDGCV